MKNKRIEDIISAAFGEHEGDLGQLSASEQRDLAQAQAIKQGLKSLKDVPEHQLSNERLRNAILGTAVQRRTTPVWGFATAAAAFVVIGIVAFQSVYKGQAGQPVVKNDGHEVGNGVVGEGNDSLVGNSSTGSDGQTNIKGSAPLVASNSSVGSSPSPAYTALDADALGPEYRANMTEGIAPVIQNASLTDSASIVPASMPGSVVLVEPNNTTPNGAAAAREVESYGNVVFGG